MDDDRKMLGYYSPDNGMEIHIVDTDPFSMSRGGGLEDESQVEKFRMTDEAYEARKGTVREYIRNEKLKDPNWKPPKPNMMSGNPWMKAPPEAEQIGHGPESVAGKEVSVYRGRGGDVEREERGGNRNGKSESRKVKCEEGNSDKGEGRRGA
jgi:hypothetical protein